MRSLGDGSSSSSNSLHCKEQQHTIEVFCFNQDCAVLNIIFS